MPPRSPAASGSALIAAIALLPAFATCECLCSDTITAIAINSGRGNRAIALPTASTTYMSEWRANVSSSAVFDKSIAGMYTTNWSTAVSSSSQGAAAAPTPVRMAVAGGSLGLVFAAFALL